MGKLSIRYSSPKKAILFFLFPGLNLSTSTPGGIISTFEIPVLLILSAVDLEKQTIRFPYSISLRKKFGKFLSKEATVCTLRTLFKIKISLTKRLVIGVVTKIR